MRNFSTGDQASIRFETENFVMKPVCGGRGRGIGMGKCQRIVEDANGAKKWRKKGFLWLDCHKQDGLDAFYQCSELNLL